MAGKKKAKLFKKSAPVKAKKPAGGKKASGKPAPKKMSAKTKPIVKAANPAPSRSPKMENWSAEFTPLDDRLVVQPEAPATKTAGGIIIPGTVNDRPVRGTVLAKGRGRRNKKGQLRPLDVTVGDSVMYSEWSGTKIDVGGQEVLILREEDVLGIVT